MPREINWTKEDRDNSVIVISEKNVKRIKIGLYIFAVVALIAAFLLR